VTAAEITDSGRLRSDDDSPIEPDVDRACLTAVGRSRHYALCHWLQAFEDAARWRHARASAPCGDCDAAAPDLCDDHARDVGLISEYRRTASQLIADAPETGS
jgi:hypothetical protein